MGNIGNAILFTLAKCAPVFMTVIILAIVIAIIVGISKTMYKKAPPNTAMVITGPDLVAALTSTSNASMLETVTKSMAPYAIARGNESVAEVTDRLLRGTNLEKLIENLGKVKE